MQNITAASSDPISIYKQLTSDCKKGEKHPTKIPQIKTSLTSLAALWLANGEITDENAKDIVYMVENADSFHWEPYLYVIPRVVVASRLKLVPINKRASFGAEYVIEDLERHEFDILEISL